MTSTEFDFDDETAGTEGQEKPKGNGLRAQLEALLAENKRLKEESEKLSAVQRAADVNAILASAGANPKIAKFIPADVAADEAAIKKWLEDEGDVFGYSKPADSLKSGDVNVSTTGDGPDLAALQAAFQRMSSADSSGQTGSASKEDVALRQMHDLAAQAGNDFERLVELQRTLMK